MLPTRHSREPKLRTSVLAAPIVGIVIAVVSGIYWPQWQGHRPAGLVGLALLAIVAAFFVFALAAAGSHRDHHNFTGHSARRRHGF